MYARILAGIAVAAVLAAGGTGDRSDESRDDSQVFGEFDEFTEGEHIKTTATRVLETDNATTATSAAGVTERRAAGRERLPFRGTQAVCETAADVDTATDMVDQACEQLAALECEEGQTPVGAAYEYVATNTMTRPEDVPDPRQTDEAFCAVNADDLADAARKEFESMRIEPSPITAKPDAEWTVINIHNPVNTTDTPQTKDVTLLGIDVQIRAVPTEFSWTFGDGSAPLVTPEPGVEWTPADGDPDESWVGHTYTQPGTYSIELTTTWHGQFRITGTPAWTDIPGQATTTTDGPTWEALEMRSVLIDEPAG